jgi:hypothetical protein
MVIAMSSRDETDGDLIVSSLERSNKKAGTRHWREKGTGSGSDVGPGRTDMGSEVREIVFKARQRRQQQNRNIHAPASDFRESAY